MPRFDINTNLLDTSVNARITSEMIADWIRSIHADSPMLQIMPGKNDPDSFLRHANENGITVFLPVCHAMLETGWGFSQDYNKFRNLFGIGHPSYADNGWNFPSTDDCISYYCSWVKRYYLQDPSVSGVGNQSHWAGAPTLAAMNVHYAEDKTWAGKLASIMNQMAVFMERYVNGPSPVIETSVLPGKVMPKLFTVVTGPWRYNVIMDIISAGLYQGTWKDNEAKFDALNPVTPPGGWKKGDRVVYDTQTIQAPVQVEEIPAPTSTPVVEAVVAPAVETPQAPIELPQISSHVVVSGDSLGKIFKSKYGKYPNWTAWNKKDKNGDLQRMINFIKVNSPHGRVDVNPKTGREDIIHIGDTLILPNSI